MPETQDFPQEVLKSENWQKIVNHFVSVLNMNILMMDKKGRVILPPKLQKYGGYFFIHSEFGFSSFLGSAGFIECFHPRGDFLEYQNDFDMHVFAVPLRSSQKTSVIGYLVVGPVVLNRKMEDKFYKQRAEQLSCDDKKILEELGEVRVVSNVVMNSILHLISDAIQESMDLAYLKFVQNKSINASDNRDFLNALLDAALKLSGVECGSIMISNGEADGVEELSIQAYRGIDPEVAKSIRIKIGEGIAGLAVKENRSFLISHENDSGEKKEDQDRVHHLLKRPEIQEAAIVPFVSPQGLRGVMNLHTKTEELSSRLKEVFPNLQSLTKLAALVV